MTIEQIIRQGRGTAGHWKVTRSDPKWLLRRIATGPYMPYVTCCLYHYGTPMAEWDKWADGTIELRHMSLGHGSVSDQGGMNTLFKTLALPYYYSRKGGAEIREVDTQG